eukprot:TRINITY_DN7792_c0_g3_i1.p1 TRINITY_DN7792_c0_g3~~TRINITY_DN7792_c0_g3_i1.p1  ORF type:complete len:550 (-),score=64.03 TRINITY_DN7792_c0_g3_i1:365-1942(-)
MTMIAQDCLMKVNSCACHDLAPHSASGQIVRVKNTFLEYFELWENVDVSRAAVGRRASRTWSPDSIAEPESELSPQPLNAKVVEAIRMVEPSPEPASLASKPYDVDSSIGCLLAFESLLLWEPDSEVSCVAPPPSPSREVSSKLVSCDVLEIDTVAVSPSVSNKPSDALQISSAKVAALKRNVAVTDVRSSRPSLTSSQPEAADSQSQADHGDFDACSHARQINGTSVQDSDACANDACKALIASAKRRRRRQRGGDKECAQVVENLQGVDSEACMRGMVRCTGQDTTQLTGREELVLEQGNAQVLDDDPVGDLKNDQQETAPVSPDHGKVSTESKSKKNKLWCHIFIDQVMLKRGFDLTKKIIGRAGVNTRAIYEATGAKIRLRGRGSGHLENGREADVHLMLAVTADLGQEDKFKEAVELSLGLLDKVAVRWAEFNQSDRRAAGDAAESASCTHWIGDASTLGWSCLPSSATWMSSKTLDDSTSPTRTERGGRNRRGSRGSCTSPSWSTDEHAKRKRAAASRS